MKFAGFPKFALLALLAGVLALALSGCGASNLALTPGNWSMTAVPSSGAAGTFYIGGNLTQNGSSLTATMSVVSSLCFSSSQVVPFTGKVNGNKVTLTSSSIGGEVITVTASGTSGSALAGTYTIVGGTTCNGDSGTLTANPVPTISGTWGGLIFSPGGVSQGGANAALALTLTQAATASSDGTFALTGSGTFTNSSCSSAATVTSAFIAGPYLVVEGDTDDGGSCDGDSDQPTFTKQ